MGNTNSSTNSQSQPEWKRKLFKCNSQEAVDPDVVRRAFESVDTRNKKPNDACSGGHHMHLYDAGVSYPEEYEGNEPTDGYSEQERYLEPEVAPHIFGIDLDDSHPDRPHPRRHSYATIENHHRRRRSSATIHHRGRKQARRVTFSNPQEEIRNLELMADSSAEEARECLQQLKSTRNLPHY